MFKNQSTERLTNARMAIHLEQMCVLLEVTQFSTCSRTVCVCGVPNSLHKSPALRRSTHIFLIEHQKGKGKEYNNILDSCL